MSAPVAELFADLGFRVDTGSLGKADAGLEALTALATRAVAAVEALTASFAQMGVTAAAAAASAKSSVPRAAKVPMQYEGPALPSDYNSALAEEKAAILRQREKSALRERALLDLDGPKHPPGDQPKHPPGDHPKHPPSGHGHGGHKKAGLTGWLESASHVTHGFLALFAGHEILHFAHEITELGVQVELTSKKLGISTEAVQQLQFAAGMSNIDAGELNTGLKFLQLNATRAAAGMKAPAAAFRALGVSTKNADGSIRPVDQLLEDVADKIKAIDDPAKQTTMAVQLFGRAGQQLVPFLQKGSEGIRELREEAEALGGGLTESLIADAEEYEHGLKKLKFAFLGVKSAIGNFLLPILTRLANGMTVLVGKFNEVYRHTKFIQTLLAVGLAATIAKLVIWFSALGQAAIMSWLKSVGGFILLAAAIAGVSLVLEDLYVAMTGGRSAIGKWLDNWQGLGTTSELVKNIAAGIDAVTQAIKNFANSPWEAFKSFMGDVVYVMGAKDVLAQDELANRAVATGRGLKADARSNIDIPRATERGLGGKADVAFGQAKASIFNARSANSDSAPIVNVHVKTDASAKEIGHHVKNALDEHQAAQNKRLHSALVMAPDAEDVEE